MRLTATSTALAAHIDRAAELREGEKVSSEPNRSRQAAEKEQLATRVHAMLDAGVDGDRRPFDQLALDLFAYQYAYNPPYREFCDAKGTSPDNIHTWEEIPAFPTQAFKTEIVATFPLEEAEMTILTSGTTNPNQRGRIFRDELGKQLALTANRVMMDAYLFPDFASGQRCRILILAPSPETAPSMGMALGMEETRERFGTPNSRFLLGRTGLDVKALVDALDQAESDGVPIALIGSTSAYVYFFQACKRKNMYWRLPAGSRVADGGGYRGRFGEVTRADYYRMVEQHLGVPWTHCVNILGMGEAGTNHCDNVLRDCITGRDSGIRHKMPPPWVRIRAVSVEDLSLLPPGEVGLLRHYDLTNLPTVVAVQSDNLGFTDGARGFEIVGRAKVIDGKVSVIPDSEPISPMPSRRIFRLVETYTKFSINFKMGRFAKRDSGGPRAEVESAEPGSVPSCPAVVDDMISAPHDAEAAKRAAHALQVYADLTEAARSQISETKQQKM